MLAFADHGAFKFVCGTAICMQACDFVVVRWLMYIHGGADDHLYSLQAQQESQQMVETFPFSKRLLSRLCCNFDSACKQHER